LSATPSMLAPLAAAADEFPSPLSDPNAPPAACPASFCCVLHARRTKATIGRALRMPQKTGLAAKRSALPSRLMSLASALLGPVSVGREVRDRVDRLELPFSRFGVDNYGISKKHLNFWFTLLGVLYKEYFRVKAYGTENIPRRGRAMLIGNHSGGIAIDGAMVIAEGARGTAKLYWERTSLVHFGTGFMRLALQTKTPIIPFGFIGGGDAFPTVFNAVELGRRFGAPYVPITAYLAPLPLPVQLAVHYGEPMHFEGTG